MKKFNLKAFTAIFGICLLLSGFTDLSPLPHEAWIKPVKGTITNPFGNGYNFFGYYRAGHTGIDIKAPVGTSVVAVAAGRVKYLKTKPNMRYGNYIVIEHNNGLYSLYAHLQKVFVKLNEKVSKNDVIGKVGVSGLASYPHLHFEVVDRIPSRDGAWGYNYICQLIGDKKFKTLLEKKLITYKDEKEDKDLVRFQVEEEKTNPKFADANVVALPLSDVEQKFNFLNVHEKKITHFFRAKKNTCEEKLIEPITYYNPENFLPKYEKSVLPDFRKYVNKNIQKVSTPKPTPEPVRETPLQLKTGK